VRPIAFLPAWPGLTQSLRPSLYPMLRCTSLRRAARATTSLTASERLPRSLSAPPSRASCRATYVGPLDLWRLRASCALRQTLNSLSLGLPLQHLQFTPDGPKRIILNPSADTKHSENNPTFAQGEVYGVDVLIATSADGKARSEEAKTTIFKKADITYQLKLKTSRTTFAEIQKKAGAFPFTLRCLDDAKRARMGVQEAVQHGLLRPYEVVNTEKGSYVAQFFFTIALLPAGPLLLSPSPAWYAADKVKSAKSVQDEELKSLIAAKLRVDKKKAKKAAKAVGEGEAKKE
jgi:hypothetical protein